VQTLPVQHFPPAELHALTFSTKSAAIAKKKEQPIADIHGLKGVYHWVGLLMD
jgi:hypothetical protein